MYFFSVDAFDTEDLRSGYSNEISHDGIKHVPPGQSALNFIKMRLSDGRIITVHSDGTVEVTLTDGTIIKVYSP
jgi:hypothetical protein